MENKNIENLSYDELEKKIAELSALKKIKDDKFKKILKEKDAAGLKSFVKENNDILSRSLLILINKTIDYIDLSHKDIKFLDILLNLRDNSSKSLLDHLIEHLTNKKAKYNIFNSNDDVFHFLTSITSCPKMTEHFTSQYFDFFHTSMMDKVNSLSIKNEEVLNILLEKKVVDMNGFDKPIGIALNMRSNILTYALDHGFVNINKEDLTWIIYKGFVANGDFNIETKELEKLIKNHGQNIVYDFATLDEYLEDVHMDESNLEEEKVKEYLSLTQERLELILSLIKIPKEYLLKCVESLNETDKDYYDDYDDPMPGIKKNILLTLENVLIHNNQEKIEKFLVKFEKEIEGKNFKKEVNRLILNYKLAGQLEDKASNNVKVKI